MTWIKDGCVALVFNNSQEKPGWQGGKSGVRERLKLLQDFAASPWHLIFATGAFAPTLVKCEERHIGAIKMKLFAVGLSIRLRVKI